MANILEVLEDVGGNILTTGGQVIGSIGTNAEAQALNNLAIANANAASVALAQQKQLADERAADENRKIARTVIFSLLGFGGIALIVLLFVMYRKNS